VTLREQEEYRALRATVRERGTARVWVFAVGFSAWATLALAVDALALPPVVALVPLVVLAATFESVFALHVAVERIGRYLLVFHGDDWEHAAGRFHASGTARLDALFTGPFLVAAFLNLIPLLITRPVVQELTVVGGGHLLFLARLFVARSVASRQRAVDTEQFTRLRDDRLAR
jgi:hypothetical protein